MEMSYTVTPLYSLSVSDFNSYEEYEEQYNTNCSFVEYTILSKKIPLYTPILSITNDLKVFDGILGNILNYFSSTFSLDFIIFEDGSCGFIKPNGDWIKLNIDRIILKCYNDNEV